MPRNKRYYVYILASKGRVLYIGITGSLMARVLQHKAQRYHVDRLVYYETFRYVGNAIARETELKKWRREKKVRSFRHRIQLGRTWRRIGASQS